MTAAASGADTFREGMRAKLSAKGCMESDAAQKKKTARITSACPMRAAASGAAASVAASVAAVAVSAAVRSSSISSGNQRWQHLQHQSQPLPLQHQLQQ